jgi:hypothetical protein
MQNPFLHVHSQYLTEELPRRNYQSQNPRKEHMIHHLLSDENME